MPRIGKIQQSPPILHDSHTRKGCQMAEGLKGIRQQAGYKTAKDLADEMGVAGSTVTRYEKEPESIPMKAAIRMADMLGCSLDDIVGRDSPATADVRGVIQQRFDALMPGRRADLSKYLGYLEEQQARDEERTRQIKESAAKMHFKHYMTMYLLETSLETCLNIDPLIARESFERLTYLRMIDKEERRPEEVEEAMREIMDVYDAYRAGDFELA